LFLEELDFSSSDNLSIHDNIIAKTILKREKSLPNLTKLNLSKCKNNIKLFVYEIILGNVLKGQLEEINFSESTTDNKALDIL